MNRQEVSSEVWKLLSKNILTQAAKKQRTIKLILTQGGRVVRGTWHRAHLPTVEANFMLITGLLPHISLAKQYIYLQNVPYTYFRNTLEANL